MTTNRTRKGPVCRVRTHSPSRPQSVTAAASAPRKQQYELRLVAHDLPAKLLPTAACRALVPYLAGTQLQERALVPEQLGLLEQQAPQRQPEPRKESWAPPTRAGPN